jgi:hypothetical protein
MAKNQAQEAAPPAEEQKPLVADENTQTIYGVTVAEIIAQGVEERERLAKEIADRDTCIEGKNAEIAALTTELDTVKQDKIAGEMLIGVLRPFRTLTMLENGSIRLPVTVPVDAATPLLSWAADAKEDPQEYIEKVLSDALMAYTSS